MHENGSSIVALRVEGACSRKKTSWYLVINITFVIH
jgi:hypothetical protein